MQETCQARFARTYERVSISDGISLYVSHLIETRPLIEKCHGNISEIGKLIHFFFLFRSTRTTGETRKNVPTCRSMRLYMCVEERKSSQGASEHIHFAYLIPHGRNESRVTGTRDEQGEGAFIHVSFLVEKLYIGSRALCTVLYDQNKVYNDT